MLDKTVTISERDYLALVRNEMWLDALIEAGVCFWEGYDDAQYIFLNWQDITTV